MLPTFRWGNKIANEDKQVLTDTIENAKRPRFTVYCRPLPPEYLGAAAHQKAILPYGLGKLTVNKKIEAGSVAQESRQQSGALQPSPERLAFASAAITKP
jgi:hypothetical protein